MFKFSGDKEPGGSGGCETVWLVWAAGSDQGGTDFVLLEPWTGLDRVKKVGRPPVSSIFFIRLSSLAIIR